MKRMILVAVIGATAVLLVGCADKLAAGDRIQCVFGWIDAVVFNSSRADVSACRWPVPPPEPTKMVPGTMGEIYREPQPLAPQEGDTQ